MQIAPAPLFRDPIYDGPTDPVIIYNRQEKKLVDHIYFAPGQCSMP